MSIDFNISSILVFFLIVNGIFVSVLLLIKRDNKKANQYLSLLAFLLSLWLLDTFFRVADIYGKNPNLYFLPIYFSLAFGPLLYCYTLQITHTKKLSIKEQFIHFIPAILQGTLYVFLQLSSYNYRHHFWIEIHKPYTYDIELGLSFLSLITYLFFSRKHLIKYKFIIENNYSNLHKITLKWLSQLHWVLFLVSLFLLLSTLFSCDEKVAETQEQEAQYIQQLYTEIQTMASSVPCENESQWNFTSYGSKACGGPVGFIAYPNTIDVNQFLQKVAAHRIAQENYNEKWQIASDCAAPVQPIDVVCENNLPVFVY